jgi:GTP 3',8-cyclase
MNVPPSKTCVQPIVLPLLDRFQRLHRSMRISVTDVCNIRCQYCMPDGAVQFLASDRHLKFEQIARLVSTFVRLGIDEYRLTGGEPLMRANLFQLVQMLKGIEGLSQVALTTNGMLLKEQLPLLADSGLRRINISLDTLNEQTFQQISRRQGLHRVLEGIEAALADPRITVRLNALVLREVNLQDVIELVQFARTRGITVRFIEFMPLDANRSWNPQRMVTGEELRSLLVQRLGELSPVASADPSQPARDFQFSDGSQVGFIDSVSQPFCAKCDRLRLTSDGKLRNCLFGKQEWDVAELFQQFDPQDIQFDRELEKLLRGCLSAKAEAHGIDSAEFNPPARAMYQIGG